MSRNKKPWVLLPAGTYGWSSYHQIYPELMECWKRAQFHLEEVWFPRPMIEDSFLLRLEKSCSKLIFPIGISHYDGLWLLAMLRKKYQLRIPAVIAISSDLTKGFAPFSHYRDIFLKGDQFVVNSMAEKEMIEYFFGQKIKVSVIPLPVNSKLFLAAKNKASLRRKYGLSQKDQILFYSGRISAQKNIHSIFACLKTLLPKYPNLKLIIAGQGDDIGVPHFKNENKIRYIHELTNLVNYFGLQQHVRFIPFLNQQELADYFNLVDVHVSLTLHSGEDFGYSIAQGLSCNTPTVVTQWGGGRDFVKHQLAFGVGVFATANGPKIDYLGACGSLERALKKVKRKSFAKSIFSQTQILKSWKKIAYSQLTPQQPIRLQTQRPYDYDKVLRIYARENKSSKGFYQNPLWDEKTGHLFDPISKKRNFRLSQGKKFLKKMGIILGY